MKGVPLHNGRGCGVNRGRGGCRITRGGRGR